MILAFAKWLNEMKNRNFRKELIILFNYDLNIWYRLKDTLNDLLYTNDSFKINDYHVKYDRLRWILKKLRIFFTIEEKREQNASYFRITEPKYEFKNFLDFCETLEALTIETHEKSYRRYIRGIIDLQRGIYDGTNSFLVYFHKQFKEELDQYSPEVLDILSTLKGHDIYIYHKLRERAKGFPFEFQEDDIIPPYYKFVPSKLFPLRTLKKAGLIGMDTKKPPLTYSKKTRTLFWLKK